jgi:hypothetical protein
MMQILIECRTHVTGYWIKLPRYFGPFTLRKGNRQRWLAARYEDDNGQSRGQVEVQASSIPWTHGRHTK